MDGTPVIFFAVIIAVGVILFAVMTFGKKIKKVDVEKYRVKWLAIEQSIEKGHEASYHLAILNADKLVDQALRDRGFRGHTMADRLKHARGKFSRRNELWSSHKLRNRIAHEQDVKVSYDQARRALSNYKHALKDLGVI